MKAQGQSIRAIAEAVKVSKSFVHKTCKKSGPQTLGIPVCKH
jgi:transposase-like protein